MATNREDENMSATENLTVYSILYSYPTWDKNYRGQRGERIAATSEQDALERIRRGEGSYGPIPDARIVRCKVAAVRPDPPALSNNEGHSDPRDPAATTHLESYDEEDLPRAIEYARTSGLTVRGES